MKECKYCRSLYEDNLSICPICGGNKVITEQEKMEEVILRQREQEFREKMDNERKAQKKKFLAVVIAFMIIVLAVIGAGFYNANKPLSNGMTRDEGEALLARGIAYYESSDYESAIECFVQLPADSKQYKEAQNTLEKAIASYVPAVLETADKYIQDAEYEVALELLKNAQTLVPENEELKIAYDAAFDAYKVVICSIAMDEADVFVANGDYANAIVSLNMALDKIGHDEELTARLQVYISKYKTVIIGRAEDMLKNVGYSDAIAVINEGLTVLSGDSDFLNKIDEYKTYAPVFLSYDDAYSINKYLRTEITDSTWLTDNYGTTYTSDRVICNKDSGMYVDEGIIQYYLGSQYRTLTGTIYVPDISKNVNTNSILVKLPYVQVWADNTLIFELNSLVNTDKPVEFSVDVSNVEFIAIKINGSWYRGNGTGLIPMNCVADLAVAK